MISNCIIHACANWLKSPARTRIIRERNASGRNHWLWEVDGKRFEFYAKGRSRLPYWRNILYKGRTVAKK